MLNHAQKEDIEDHEDLFALTVNGLTHWVSRHCPHREGRLDHGVLNENKRTLTCPLHRSVFSLDTGEQISGPSCGRIRVHQESLHLSLKEHTMPHHYTHEQVWSPLAESLTEWDDSFHQLMLNDRLRMTAYRKAIFETVQPGDRVLDLGTGTGILAQWALEAGAAHVIGIDLSAPILDLAVARMQRAGLADRFRPIHALSYDVDLPEPVDVLMSEIIGNMADNENFQPILQDAIRRFLKPQGKLLPQSTCAYLVPVTAVRAHANVSSGRVARLTPHYEVAQLYRDRDITSPFNIYYDCILPRSTYLSRPQLAASYHGDWSQSSSYSRSLSFTLTERGPVTGFKAYFIAQLSDATVLDISGDDIESGASSDSWKHAYLPIEQPIEVEPGDRLEMYWSRSTPDNPHGFAQAYRWRGEIKRGHQLLGRFDQSMDEALLRL